MLHHLLLHLVDADNPASVVSELRDQFIGALRREFPVERTPVVLTPLLYPDKNNLSTDQLNPTTLSLPRSVVSQTTCHVVGAAKLEEINRHSDINLMLVYRDKLTHRVVAVLADIFGYVLL